MTILIFSALTSAYARAADAQPSAAGGHQLYSNYCARCHGLNMVNTGAAFDLRTFPKDQQDRFERSVMKGLRAMPAWNGILKPDDVQALWLYISSGGSL